MVSFPYGLGFDIYKKSPRQIQNAIGILMSPIPRSLMLGSGFHDKLKFLIQSEKWSFGQLVEYQEKRLRYLMGHSYNNVPYYHEILRQNNLYPSDIKKIEDLKKLPILTKENIRNNFNKLVVDNYSKFRPGLAYTSGSTGLPLTFYLDQQTREIEYGTIWRHAFWNGLKDINLKIATLRGDFASEYKKENILYKYNGLTKELIFNTYILEKAYIKNIIKKLNEYKPDLIKGYPHVLFLIARYILEYKIELKFKPKLIQTSSEQLTTQMIQTIDNAFNARVSDWYSQAEYVISMGQCKQGTYHQNMETGILEIVEDEYGSERIYGTSLWNFSMPFIRYEIGDTVKIGKNCECGKQHISIESLEGRIDDMIETQNGKMISAGSFNTYWERRILCNLTIIPEYVQFLQEKIDKIVIKLFSNESIQKNEEQFIINELVLLLGENMQFEFKYLDKLPEIKKWRLVESKVNHNDNSII